MLAQFQPNFVTMPASLRFVDNFQDFIAEAEVVINANNVKSKQSNRPKIIKPIGLKGKG